MVEVHGQDAVTVRRDMGKGWPVDSHSRSQTSNVTRAYISRSRMTKDVDEPLVTVMSVNGDCDCRRARRDRFDSKACSLSQSACACSGWATFRRT